MIESILRSLPWRGWGVVRLNDATEAVVFASLLGAGYIKAQSVSGIDRVFQARLTGKGREVIRQLDKRAVV